MPKPIRIVSDGTPFGTRVMCGDVELDNVASATWEMNWSGRGGPTIPTATLVIFCPEVDVTVQDPKIERPASGKGQLGAPTTE
jgi:hypothetical protein